MGGAYAGDVYRKVLFENPGNTNHWLKIKLIGVKSNRAAIGARIKVTVETASGRRTIYKTVNSGGSFGANPLRQEIGLGNAKSIAEVEIFWPTSGSRQILSNLREDHCYQIQEGNPESVLIELKSFKLRGLSEAGGHLHHGHLHD